MLVDLQEAGESLCQMPFLAHADVQPATTLLFILSCIPSPVRVPHDSSVLHALIERLTVKASFSARQAMLAQIFNTVCELLMVIALP